MISPLRFGILSLFVSVLLQLASVRGQDFAALGPSSPPSDGSNWQLDWLPRDLLFTSYIAGEKEPRLSTAFLYADHEDIHWDSVLGGRVGLLRFGTIGDSSSEGWQLDFEGGAFLRMLPQEERDVMAVDFRAGLPATYRLGSIQAKAGYYHISSHLGDEYLLKHPGLERNDYSRDAIAVAVGYFLWDDLRLYGEVGYGFWVQGGAEPWEFQAGAEWAPSGPTGPLGTPFAAVNAHLREEVDWGGSASIFAGWQWRGRESNHTLRFGLQYFNGQTNQYSFLGWADERIGFRLSYDF
jgi:hypothetical protein